MFESNSIKIGADRIFVGDTSYFNIKSILECGQVFRYQFADGGYHVWSLDKHAFIVQNERGAEIFTRDTNYFHHYFDLDRDYQKIADTVAINDVMKRAVSYGKGIRLLNQDLTETLFSFILSSNNNIKRIQMIIERLCERLGEKTEFGYAFPSLGRLAAENVDFYREIGCGYRAEYIVATARALADGFDLTRLAEMTTAEAKKEIMRLKGVGAKVADCVLLFGLKKTDSFPVDTWLEKVYEKYFSDGKNLTRGKITDFFVEKFGENSGFAQQYLFYFERELLQNNDK